MRFIDVCCKYNLKAKGFSAGILMDGVKTTTLEEARTLMKKRVKEIDDITSKSKSLSNKELQTLADERFYTNKAMDTIYSELIKRKRRGTDISTKALNHGGVYSDIKYEAPKIGRGFKGYKGITL